MNGYPRPELLATSEWLAENIARPGFQVLDARWRPDGTGRRLYAAAHIPGATYMDWREDLAEQEEDGDALLLAGPRKVTEAMARAGLGNGMVGVIYDDTANNYAARVWWNLRVYGFDSARLLTGGFEAWRELRPVSGTVEVRPPTTFTPRLQARLRLTAADVRDLIGSERAQFLDARAPAQYLGREGTARRLGHIPGAVNVPAAATTQPRTGRFCSPEDLQAQLRRAGVLQRRRLICYDATGIEASKLAFALTLMGYDEVSVYDGGWAEWGNRLDLPVER